eukprot:CAMPEP_0171146876 /NCGR_PEP_ID=MMETSP0766_2-20121228/147783_1 /TAXON_ID=439317 /ORGANISM="Gambierdiscus australes, Strain CAWD 149" /LENGTH=219 /DNA_ID=CAMNT_0011610783 /DNA_START=281 /DNA_END=939 /DNA_ORIENTATION=+
MRCSSDKRLEAAKHLWILDAGAEVAPELPQHQEQAILGECKLEYHAGHRSGQERKESRFRLDVLPVHKRKEWHHPERQTRHKAAQSLQALKLTSNRFESSGGRGIICKDPLGVEGHNEEDPVSFGFVDAIRHAMIEKSSVQALAAARRRLSVTWPDFLSKLCEKTVPSATMAPVRRGHRSCDDAKEVPGAHEAAHREVLLGAGLIAPGSGTALQVRLRL